MPLYIPEGPPLGAGCSSASTIPPALVVIGAPAGVALAACVLNCAAASTALAPLISHTYTSPVSVVLGFTVMLVVPPLVLAAYHMSFHEPLPDCVFTDRAPATCWYALPALSFMLDITGVVPAVL